MNRHPLVKDVFVMDRDDSKGGKYLCAYIVPREEKTEIKTGRLSEKEKTRYKRQMLLDGWGVESQEKLKDTTVFVAGAGGGASPTITQLALAGFGTIVICDHDNVELSNLNRQFLHDESRIGMNKALSAQKTVNRLNPNVTVIPISEKLTRENVFDLVGDASIIFDMFDGLESKFILSECAVAKQVPHVVAAMTELSSYSAIFHSPYTPCYHCLFDREKFDDLNKIREVVENYEKNPLHVVASSLFAGTGFAVTEAIKIVLGFENPAYNKFFFFNQKASPNIAHTDGYKMMTFAFSRHFRQISLEQGFDWESGWNGNFIVELETGRDPNCPVCSREKEPTAIKKSKKEKQSLYSLSQLREYLMTTLPEYMVPSYFVQLEKIPLTPNGKIDRNALPEPGTGTKPGDYTAPADEFEEKLTRVWSEVLGIDKENIGTTTNFFELGGNSLNLIMLVSEIYKEFGIEVAINQIFDNPNIKDISKYIRSNKKVQEPLLVFNQSVKTGKKLFCFPPAAGAGLAYEGLASQIDDFSVYSFNFLEEDDRLKNYVDIITNHQPIGPYILFGWSAAGGLIFEVARALENYGGDVSDIIFADCYWNEETIPVDSGAHQAFLRNIETLLEGWGLAFLKERVQGRAENYMRYIQNLTHLETIDANVHLIISEEIRRSGGKNKGSGWDKFTNRSVITYDGFGDHQHMFSPGPLEKNASLIRDILRDISNK